MLIPSNYEKSIEDLFSSRKDEEHHIQQKTEPTENNEEYMKDRNRLMKHCEHMTNVITPMEQNKTHLIIKILSMKHATERVNHSIVIDITMEYIERHNQLHQNKTKLTKCTNAFKKLRNELEENGMRPEERYSEVNKRKTKFEEHCAECIQRETNLKQLWYKICRDKQRIQIEAHFRRDAIQRHQSYEEDFIKLRTEHKKREMELVERSVEYIRGDKIRLAEKYKDCKEHETQSFKLFEQLTKKHKTMCNLFRHHETQQYETLNVHNGWEMISSTTQLESYVHSENCNIIRPTILYLAQIYTESGADLKLLHLPQHHTESSAASILLYLPQHYNESGTAPILLHLPQHHTESGAAPILFYLPQHYNESGAAPILLHLPQHHTESGTAPILLYLPQHYNESGAAPILLHLPQHHTESGAPPILLHLPQHHTESGAAPILLYLPQHYNESGAAPILLHLPQHYNESGATPILLHLPQYHTESGVTPILLHLPQHHTESGAAPILLYLPQHYNESGAAPILLHLPQHHTESGAAPILLYVPQHYNESGAAPILLHLSQHHTESGAPPILLHLPQHHTESGAAPILLYLPQHYNESGTAPILLHLPQHHTESGAAPILFYLPQHYNESGAAPILLHLPQHHTESGAAPILLYVPQHYNESGADPILLHLPQHHTESGALPVLLHLPQHYSESGASPILLNLPQHYTESGVTSIYFHLPQHYNESVAAPILLHLPQHHTGNGAAPILLHLPQHHTENDAAPILFHLTLNHDQYDVVSKFDSSIKCTEVISIITKQMEHDIIQTRSYDRSEDLIVIPPILIGLPLGHAEDDAFSILDLSIKHTKDTSVITEQLTYDVFISYAWQDDHIIQRIQNALPQCCSTYIKDNVSPTSTKSGLDNTSMAVIAVIDKEYESDTVCKTDMIDIFKRQFPLVLVVSNNYFEPITDWLTIVWNSLNTQVVFLEYPDFEENLCSAITHAQSNFSPNLDTFKTMQPTIDNRTMPFSNDGYEWIVTCENPIQLCQEYRQLINDPRRIVTGTKLVDIYFKYICIYFENSTVMDLIEEGAYKNDISSFILAYTRSGEFSRILNRHLAANVQYYFESKLYDTVDYQLVKSLIDIVALHIYRQELWPHVFTGTVYRGMVISEKDLSKYVVGCRFMNVSFLSTSKNKNVAEVFCGQNQAAGFSVLCTYVIHNKNNRRTALDIELMSWFPSEEEVWILPLSPFYVFDVMRLSDRPEYIEIICIEDETDTAAIAA